MNSNQEKALRIMREYIEQDQIMTDWEFVIQGIPSKDVQDLIDRGIIEEIGGNGGFYVEVKND